LFFEEARLGRNLAFNDNRLIDRKEAQMAFAEDQLLEQQNMFEELKEELSRLNSLFDSQLKACGLTEADLKDIDLDAAPPEVKKMLDQAKMEAQRAGEIRAGQARQTIDRPSGSPSRRRDTIKL
jgi:hypothetical protein